ncbi:DNA-binding response regulator [Actinoplanes sp. NBRC 14428]|uniref:LuxR family two component transcriptional regulator n=1 Tax=Pseudosporangium ferrugineum TaxID=439699 RepID=A0A2T0SEH0_9ACTN|nr:response regulator transcription factor [Pseudosporangium ferrugineum]PRY31807.1 LuxR family two component transcriptional regulator [Pseudosporangium ferrugineum]BCJ49960.1 DNA-binding response regulator [Actinoplanes sp. NBRC 14428]
MITVLIVDDQPLQRFGFRMLLDSHPDTEVVGEAQNGAEAVRQATELHPDVVLMDVRMPGMDGIEATRRIVADGGRSHILMLTTFDLDEYVHAALRAGASGFLLKDAYPEELLAGIRAVAAGDAVIAPVLTRRLLDAFAGRLGDGPDGTRPPADPRLATLTEREREILVAIGRGWTNGEIAERLVLSESTVKTHVGRVLAKVGARDRVQAVIFAYDQGLTRPQRPG